MKTKERIKTIEERLDDLFECVSAQADAIRILQQQIECGHRGGFGYFPIIGEEPKRTRIDCALEENAKLQEQINVLCESLGVKIWGREEMPFFDVQKIPAEEKPTE